MQLISRSSDQGMQMFQIPEIINDSGNQNDYQEKK